MDTRFSSHAAGLDTCEAPYMRICLEEQCSCVAPSMPPGEPKPIREQCTVTVGYAPTSPDMPWLKFSSGACAMNAEIALAVALTALLKLSGPLTPVPKCTPERPCE